MTTVEELRSDLMEIRAWDAAARLDTLSELDLTEHLHTKVALDYILRALVEAQEKERGNESRAVAEEGVMGYSDRSSNRSSGERGRADQRRVEGRDTETGRRPVADHHGDLGQG